MWICIPKYWFTLFCREKFLSRIYALFGVPFTGLKNVVAYQQWQLWGMLIPIILIIGVLLVDNRPIPEAGAVAEEPENDREEVKDKFIKKLNWFYSNSEHLMLYEKKCVFVQPWILERSKMVLLFISSVENCWWLVTPNLKI